MSNLLLMKNIFLLLCFTAVIASRIEAASDFTVSLSGDPVYYGQGTFFLDGSSLSYSLKTEPYGFNGAEIRGPAGPNETAPVLYNLRLTRCMAPGGDTLGYCTFGGTLTISDAQAVDLQNGLWYVLSPFDNPNRTIRGQITAVPEPSTWALVLVGASMGWLVWRRRANQRA